MELTRQVYKITAEFPKTESYGLSDQLRRAAVSIPSNIAEGFQRRSMKENAQFLTIAYGSTSEVDTQLILSRDLGYVSSECYMSADALLVEIRKILNTIMSHLRSN